VTVEYRDSLSPPKTFGTFLFIHSGQQSGRERSDIVFRKSKENATRLGAGRSLKGFPASGLPANVEADRDTDS
jgi:hypothetical protein